MSMSLTGSCFSSDSAPRPFHHWDSKTRWNNLLDGLAVGMTAGPSDRTISAHPSSREGHHSTIGWKLDFLPCRRYDGRSKRPNDLTSSIVPRGTSFHHCVEARFPPIAFDPA